MASLSGLWPAIGRQLQNPSGLGGRLLGVLMGLANRDSNRLAIDALKIAPNDTILELGFGSGRALKTLAGLAPDGCVMGIDHSAVMLAQAARFNRHDIRKGRVFLLRGRFDALPCRAESFDKILAVHVTYFAGVEDICEARRVLRPGGSMVVLATDKSVMCRWKFTQETHRLYDQDELAALLLGGGFANREIGVLDIKLMSGTPGLLAIARKPAESPGRRQKTA